MITKKAIIKDPSLNCGEDIVTLIETLNAPTSIDGNDILELIRKLNVKI